jgi:hypothetical protein
MCDAIIGRLVAQADTADECHPPLPEVTVLVYHGRLCYQLVTSDQAHAEGGALNLGRKRVRPVAGLGFKGAYAK